MNFLASTTSFLPSTFALPGEVDEDVFLSANKKKIIKFNISAKISRFVMVIYLFVIRHEILLPINRIDKKIREFSI